MYHVLIDPDCLKADGTHTNDEIIAQFIDFLFDIKQMEEFEFLTPLVPMEAYDMDYDESVNIFNLPSKLSGSSDYAGKDFYSLLNYLTKTDPIDYVSEEEYSFQSFSIMGENGEEAGHGGFSISKNLAMNLIASNIDRGNTVLRSKLKQVLECRSEIRHLKKNELHQFQDVLKLFDSTIQILSEIDLIELWKEAETTAEYEELIRVYIMIHHQGKAMRNWEIGGQFFDNLKKYGFHTEPTKVIALLKAMLYIAWTDDMNRKTHKLRTSKSGGAPPVVSNLGKGMRMDIDQEFHLHYWENQNKIIYASINTHNDFSIPTG